MTPRQSAAVHLPALDETFDRLRSTFGAKLESLTTPDGSWGTDPTADWPRLPGLPWTPPWPPVDNSKSSKRAKR
jgi:hypothetical protein